MRNLLIIFILCSIGIIVRHVRISDTKIVSEEKSVATTPQPRGDSAEAVGSTPPNVRVPNAKPNANLQELSTKIERLQKEREELKHSLAMQGFPEILNGDRLSESERDQILNQASKLNEMNIRIVKLKNQKVEMETEVDL